MFFIKCILNYLRLAAQCLYLKIRYRLSGGEIYIDYGWIKLIFSNDNDMQEVLYHANDTCNQAQKALSLFLFPAWCLCFLCLPSYGYVQMNLLYLPFRSITILGDYLEERKGVQVLTTSDATRATTGTTTELPNCLYAWVSETGILNVSGKLIRRAHSRGVSLRGFLPRCGISISEPSLQQRALRVRVIPSRSGRPYPNPLPFF